MSSTHKHVLVKLSRFRPETTILPDLIVTQYFLSSEYQLYACGKKYCAPRSRPKYLVSGRKLSRNSDKFFNFRDECCKADVTGLLIKTNT